MKCSIKNIFVIREITKQPGEIIFALKDAANKREKVSLVFPDEEAASTFMDAIKKAGFVQDNDFEQNKDEDNAVDIDTQKFVSKGFSKAVAEYMVKKNGEVKFNRNFMKSPVTGGDDTKPISSRSLTKEAHVGERRPNEIVDILKKNASRGEKTTLAFPDGRIRDAFCAAAERAGFKKWDDFSPEESETCEIKTRRWVQRGLEKKIAEFLDKFDGGIAIDPWQAITNKGFYR
jgi:ribosomal protein S8